jgi:hypothetical protein
MTGYAVAPCRHRHSLLLGCAISDVQYELNAGDCRFGKEELLFFFFFFGTTCSKIVYVQEEKLVPFLFLL